MNLEVIWSGATWRNYPTPTVAASQRTDDASEQAPSALRLDALYAAMTDDWQSRAEIQDRVTISRRRVTVYVRHLIEQGRLERKVEMLGHPRRPTHFYRRRRQTQEAA